MHDIRNSDIYFVNHLHFVNEKNENKALTFLYHNIFGNIILKILIQKRVSDAIGRYYDSKKSIKHIEKFIKKNDISMKEYKEKEYTSFNDFFTREKRKIHFDLQESSLCAPCDGYLSAYVVTKESTFQIKGISYTLEELLQNHALSKKYLDGVMYVFRLTPKNYHRYHYFDDGDLLMKKHIDGVYHTVREVALKSRKVFIENEREYSVLKTRHFKDVIYMEVGALAVGKIKNHNKKSFNRGEEKGMFLFGGSTVILLFEKNVLKKDVKLMKNSMDGLEAVVQCGCIVGEKYE